MCSPTVITGCEDCRFWMREGTRTVHDMGRSFEEEEGLCRRHAPRVDRTWPMTDWSDWCGEFEPSEGVQS